MTVREDDRRLRGSDRRRSRQKTGGNDRLSDCQTTDQRAYERGDETEGRGVCGSWTSSHVSWGQGVM